MGDEAGHGIIDGSHNVCIGAGAGGSVVSGNTNTVLGDGAGVNVINGTGNIYIGANAAGPSDELRFVRIGDTSFTDYDCFITGIIGREVDATTAALVLVDNNQKLGTVPVDANGHRVNFQAMLNETFQQQKRVAELEATVQRQQEAMEALTTQLQQQTAQIQKVCAQLEMGQAATKVVVNEP
jgi:hypothetical protein